MSESSPGAASEAEEILLPARLAPFAPPDPEAEARTAKRLADMTNNQLRQRRDKIDRRLYELGLEIGTPALAIPSVRGTGLVDLDRILRKLGRLLEAREQAELEREVDRAEGGVLAKIDFRWLSDLFRSREIRTRRQLLTSELGLALCAADRKVLGEYAPHVKALLDGQVQEARRVDELFVEMRLVDEELERRVREGRDRDPEKEIDLLLTKALDSVDDVSTRVGGKVAELSLKAAQEAASGGGQAAWALAKGAAQGALNLGGKTLDRIRSGEGEEGSEEVEPLDAPLPSSPLQSGPQPGVGSEIPGLIRELARLEAEGILTPEEFQAKKAELLRRL